MARYFKDTFDNFDTQTLQVSFLYNSIKNLARSLTLIPSWFQGSSDTQSFDITILSKEKKVSIAFLSSLIIWQNELLEYDSFLGVCVCFL